MPDLAGRVALVTGASRGVGRGVAIALAQAGATVYATGRTVASANLPGSVIRVPCDHTNDEAVERLFSRLLREAGRLDILVNAAWGGYERMVEGDVFTWPLPFWEQPLWRWDAMVDAGVRAAFVASAKAARMMIPARQGFIVNLSAWAARKHLGNVIYGIAKAATDKLTADTAHELRPHGVSVVSLYPGLVRTEAVLRSGAFDLTDSESAEFTGLAVAALASDPRLPDRAGAALVVAELACEYGFTDLDGTQPRPMRIEDA